MTPSLPGRVLLVAALAAAQSRAAASQEPVAGAGTADARTPVPAASMRFTDPEGKPLPFASDEELLVFLRDADVKSEKELSGGITFPRKVLLEKNGVRANAVFRDVHEEKLQASLANGRSELYFRDDYIFEPAAYQLSLLLGLDTVPPATLRKLHNKKGSVQIWVENSITDRKRVEQKIQPPDETRWNKQLQRMNVFDALVYNTDRSRGNMLITPDWKIWMIDHTRAFRQHGSLQNADAIHQCERGMYQKLKALDEAVLKERLKEYLSIYELNALWKRRNLLLEHLDKLIAERGEEKVLYEFTDRADAAPTP